MATKDSGQVKVLIVGAGLSGLCAADLLTKSGVNVEVLEALDRVGGRTYTIDGVDMGGAFIGPKKKRTIFLAEQLGVNQIALKKDGLYTFLLGGEIVRTKLALPFEKLDLLDLMALLQGLIDIWWKTRELDLVEPWKSKHALEWDKMTVQNYFDSLHNTEISDELFRIIVEVLVGVEPWEMSLLYFLWYIKSGHGIIDILTDAQEAIFEGGSQQLSQKLVTQIGNVSVNNKVTTSDPTLKISKTEDNKVSFTQQSGSTAEGDYAIVATTPTVRNQIKFDNVNYNGLYMQYAQRMPMGSILKTFMHYDKRWWYENGFNGIATVTGGDSYVGQTFDVSQQTSNPCLMGFVLGDKAREWQTLTTDEKKNVLKKEYTFLFSDGKQMPNCIKFEDYDWLGVSYIGGTGGIAGPGTTTTFHQAISTPIDGKIYFAGTETASEWSGYMDGAIQSGWNAAKEILNKENIPYEDPEKLIKKDKTFLEEIEALCLWIIKEIIKFLGSGGKKVVKQLPEFDTVEKVFKKMCEIGFSASNEELKIIISENLESMQQLLQEFEKKEIKLQLSKPEDRIKQLMATKLQNLNGISTGEAENIMQYIGSHLKFEGDIPREAKLQEPKEMPTDPKLNHIKHYFGVYYPENIAQVVDLVIHSRIEKKIARCKGAGHSVKDSIYQRHEINMVLSGDLRAVSLVKKLPEGKAVFKVGGGCYIGKNPMDLSSTRENSLSYQISQLGYAISIVGGISHQSIAGFMLTGSSGGSVKFGLPETIREIQFVNGKGEIKTVSPTVDSHLFYAVGVSMGLFGIVISVTIEVDPYFNVEGKESNVMEEDSSISPDRFLTCLKEVEYYHVQWLPQKGVNRVDEFLAKKTQSTDIKPYEHEIKNICVAIAASIALKLIDGILKLYTTITPKHEKIISTILQVFMPIPYDLTFCDYWYIALPNDDLAPIDSCLKVDFMEMWFPIDYANDLIQTLKDKVFTDPKKCGSITTELYGIEGISVLAKHGIR